MTADDRPRVRWSAISKSYGGARALIDADLSIAPGEIRALVGENGSGKSTLIGVLAGDVRPEHGEVHVDGQRLRVGNPADRLRAGVAVAYQDPRLCLDLTVAENLALGRLRGPRFLYSRRETLIDAARLLSDLDLALEPDAVVSGLSQDERYLCEVARVVATCPKVMALDETTASLTVDAVEVVLRIARQMAASGTSVVFVSHRLDEVMSLSDSVTVLRDGRVIDTLPTSDVTEPEVVSMMVGREFDSEYRRPHLSLGEPLLRMNGLEGGKIGHPVDLEVRAGEVLGIGGLAGSGRSTLLRLVYGAQGRRQGNVAVDGQAVGASVRDSIEHGIGYVAEDRRKEGLALHQSVRANARLLQVGLRGLWRRASRAQEQSLVDDLFQRLSLKARSASVPVRTLSGGNQQKIVIGRWLQVPIKVLLLDEPTRGVDIRTKHEIYALLHELAEAGAAIVAVTSDLVELISISDRIAVMREGRLTQMFARGVTASEIGDAMAATAPATSSPAETLV